MQDYISEWRYNCIMQRLNSFVNLLEHEKTCFSREQAKSEKNMFEAENEIIRSAYAHQKTVIDTEYAMVKHILELAGFCGITEAVEEWRKEKGEKTKNDNEKDI